MDPCVDPMGLLSVRFKTEPPDEGASTSTSPALYYHEDLNLDEEHGDLSKICRICGVSDEPILKIFEDECKKNKIPEKINKYLPIQVTMEDPLPKTICTNCFHLIENWHGLVSRTKIIETKLKEKCRTDARLPINEPTETDRNKNTDEEIVPIIENYTYTRQDRHGLFEMPQFKALVPALLLHGRPVESPQNLRRWCQICCENFARELFTTHVYTMHAEFQLHCDECDTFVDKPEYVAHMSQHSYDRCVEKEKRAKKLVKKMLDVNLAWYVRPHFCDCKNLLCTFNKEMFYKICPAHVDYDCITETLAHKLNISVEKIRCAYEEHFLERVSRRRKLVSLPTELNTIGTPKQLKLAGRINNRKILDSLDKIMAIRRLTDLHPEAVYTYKTVNESNVPEQELLPGRPVLVHDYNIQVKLEMEDDLNNNTEANGDTDTPEVRRIERARKCRFCDKVYTSSLSYFIHVRHAHKESQGLVPPTRPPPAFQCRDCNKRLANKKSLLIHRRHHKGVKYYHCSACDKSFRWRIHLEKHEKVHGPRVKYACPICQKVFTVKCDLLKHKRKHIVKNFPCTICNEKFTGERYLKIHVTRKHKDKQKMEKMPKKVKAIKSTTDVGRIKPIMEIRRMSERKKI